MDNNLKRSIILEHYQHPHHRGLVDDKSYIKANMNNESCIDELNVMVKEEDGILKDIRFDGEACALCISSASIMTDTLIGKKIEDVEKILTNFLNMATEKPYDEKLLEEAIVYNDVSKSPNREKCVLLSWWAIEKILNELKDKKHK
ncbi:MAG: SUF system NifU family Fe-S cluster assembly protein [Bacilli bacterium]|nr:SUF system NifU family Fe-S cluster assembly protein [Bacilli bacterium]